MKKLDIVPRINVALTRAQMALKKNKQKGLTTVEYAVAGSLIALTVIVAFEQLGLTVAEVINAIESTINPDNN